MVEIDTLYPEACKILQAASKEDLTVKSIKHGGSGRQIIRISLNPEAVRLIPSELDEQTSPTNLESIIGMIYSVDKAENLHFAPQADWLNQEGINAPRIFSHNTELGYALVEDLGSDDLYAKKDADWLDVRKPLYLKAIDNINALHLLSPKEELPLEPEFDTELYLWEQNYFFSFYLGQYLGLQHSHKEELQELKENETLHRMASKLGNLKKSLIHRDFQSQNIMVKDDDTYIVDFQGMRLGRPEYDFASLIYDPYMDLSEEEIAELKEHASAISDAPEEHFDIMLTQCAIQRLMQALGAFAKLTAQGYTHFERYIPAALRSLRTLAEQHLNIPELNQFLAIEKED